MHNYFLINYSYISLSEKNISFNPPLVENTRTYICEWNSAGLVCWWIRYLGINRRSAQTRSAEFCVIKKSFFSRSISDLIWGKRPKASECQSETHRLQTGRLHTGSADFCPTCVTTADWDLFSIRIGSIYGLRFKNSLMFVNFIFSLVMWRHFKRHVHGCTVIHSLV